MMVGGTVIEVRPMTIKAGHYPGKMIDVVRIWCLDRNGDERAVYAKRYVDCKVEPGDSVWWQGGKVFWTPKDRSVIDVPLEKVAFSFDPQPRLSQKDGGG